MAEPKGAAGAPEPGPAPRRPLWRDLRGVRRRLLLQLSSLGLVAAPSASYHLQITSDWPEGVFFRFLLLLGPLLAFITWLIARRTRTRMPIFWALGQRGHQPTQAELRQALSELAGFPSFFFRVNFEHWIVALLTLTGAMWLFVPDAPATLELRILAVGLCFSPFTAVLARFLSQGACREAIQRIVEEGVPSGEVFKAVPSERFQLRNHLVMFVAFALMFPVVFTADAAFAIAQKDMERLVRESDRAARVQLEEALAQRPAWPPFALFGLSAVVSLATAFLLGTMLRRPLRRIGEQALRLARGTTATAQVIPAEGEAWVVSAAFTRMQEQLAANLGRLQGAGGRLSSTGQQLVATFDDQRSGANEQASALNETFATTEELARSAAQIAENAQEVAGVAQKTLSAAVEGQKSSEQFHASMLRMKFDNQAVADSVVKLNKRMQQIGKIVEFINGIADKSDLLALNAELEGTKAGRVGKGFSLVAAEMRRLSENVMQSTQEISRLIQEIRDATNAAVMATEAGLKATDAGAESADRVLESLTQILGLATQTSEAVRSISLATQQQQTGTSQLAEAMGEILRVTEQSADATRQMNSATADLSSLAKDLTQVVETFRQPSELPAAPPAAMPSQGGATV